MSCHNSDRAHSCLFCVAINVLLFSAVNRCEAQQMAFPAESWEMSSPESMLVDAQQLEAAVNSLFQIDDMVVVRNGRVIWMGDSANRSQHVYSVTKSVASTVLGLMIDDGTVTLDTQLSEIVPALAGEYPDATFRHFVTQTSGYRGTTFDPQTPWFTPPGSQWLYNNSYDMMAYALTLAAGEPLQDLFTRRIATPIQMPSGEFAWGEYTADDGTVVDGGAGFIDRGVAVSADSAARLGHLFLNRGAWDDVQLISGDWVDAATQVQIGQMPIHPQSDVNSGPSSYGFGWWVIQPGWYDALGFSNNHLSVNPAGGFVTVSLGTSSGGNSLGDFRMFQNSLRNAVLPAIWDEQGDGNWDDFDVATSQPRWVTESGLTPDIYPTSRAIIRSDTVTIPSTSQIWVVGDVTVEQSGTLAIKRALQADSVEVAGEGTVAIEAVLEANSVDIGGNGTFIVDGDFSTTTLTVAHGTMVLHDTNALIVENRMSLSDDSQILFKITDAIWDSPFTSAHPRRPLFFAGSLVLDFDNVTDLSEFEGATLNLFDWAATAQASSEFGQVIYPDHIELDLSQLYVSGEVTVVSAVPEPGAIFLICVLFLFLPKRGIGLASWFSGNRNSLSRR